MTTATDVRAMVERLKFVLRAMEREGEVLLTETSDRHLFDGPIVMLEWFERENFALAANQCHAGYSGESGDHMCRHIDEIRDLRAAVDDVARQVEDADAGIGNSPEWRMAWSNLTAARHG